MQKFCFARAQRRCLHGCKKERLSQGGKGHLAVYYTSPQHISTKFYQEMPINWGAWLIPRFSCFVIFSTPFQDRRLKFSGNKKIHILHIFTKFNLEFILIGVLDRFLDFLVFMNFSTLIQDRWLKFLVYTLHISIKFY